MDDQHLDDAQMIAELENLAVPFRRVIFGDCRFCGAPIVIAGTTKANRKLGLLPPTPNPGPWRAFDRRPVTSRDAWRSSKRHGFIPNRIGAVGFLPHDCPNADHSS